MCLGSLSCWNVLSPFGISNFSKLSTIPLFKISQYCSPLMISWTSVNTPTPFHPIQSYTIRLFPPPCSTVGVVVQSESGSPSSSKYRSFHLIQSCWFWSHMTTRSSSNPHCSVFIVSGKFEALQSVGFFEKRMFPLNNSMKVILFECIPDCLGCKPAPYIQHFPCMSDCLIVCSF